MKEERAKKRLTNSALRSTLNFGEAISSRPPLILSTIVIYIKKNWAREDDLFNPEIKKTKKQEVRQLTTQLMKEKDKIDLNKYAPSVPVTGEVLLRYLLAQPEPLLTVDNYDAWIFTLTISEEEDRIQQMKELFTSLPKYYKLAARELLHFLQFLLEKELDPQPLLSTLSEIFGEVFLRPAEQLYYMEDDPEKVVQVVSTLISNAPTILNELDTTQPNSKQKGYISTPQAIQNRPKTRDHSKRVLKKDAQKFPDKVRSVTKNVSTMKEVLLDENNSTTSLDSIMVKSNGGEDRKPKEETKRENKKKRKEKKN